MNHTDVSQLDTSLESFEPDSIENYETDSIEAALDALRRGQLIIVSDDESRENEGDLLMAAEFVTPHAINFMITHARGLICTPITTDRARELELEPMTANNTESHGTAFTVSVDGGPEDGVATGISAYDRAQTIGLVVHGKASQLRRPGHIFPLVAKPGGVLEREGHTEAAVDLARLAGCEPVGVIVEIIKADGTMARFPDLVEFARTHGLVFTTIEKLKDYRREQERSAA
jgi:3,4-dihydroxy-2-butanone 4-phosphate synthase